MTDEPLSPLCNNEPTSQNINTARRLLDVHTRVHVPEPTCQYCFKPWPCADAAWATRILAHAPHTRTPENA